MHLTVVLPHTLMWHVHHLPEYFKIDQSKRRCQGLGWKIHDRAKSFVFPSYTMHELRNQHVSIG